MYSTGVRQQADRDISSTFCHGCGLQARGYRLQASGFRLRASGCRLQASGYRLRASGFKRHEIQVLRRAGHTLTADLALRTLVSVGPTMEVIHDTHP
jgi:hypothetical protein